MSKEYKIDEKNGLTPFKVAAWFMLASGYLEGESHKINLEPPKPDVSFMNSIAKHPLPSASKTWGLQIASVSVVSFCCPTSDNVHAEH